MKYVMMILMAVTAAGCGSKAPGSSVTGSDTTKTTQAVSSDHVFVVTYYVANGAAAFTNDFDMGGSCWAHGTVVGLNAACAANDPNPACLNQMVVTCTSAAIVSLDVALTQVTAAPLEITVFQDGAQIDHAVLNTVGDHFSL